MSRKEVIRPGLLRALATGRSRRAKWRGRCRVTVRHVYRLQPRFAAGGAAGLVHRGRGRPSARRLAPAVRERVAALMETVYDGLNDCHLTEKLHEVEGLRLCRESVRRIRQRLGRPATQPRRPPRHRRRRPPAARAGRLLLLDGSPADWLEARGPRLTLHGALDDATGAVLALHFRPTEDLHGYATLFAQVFATHGLPVACYGDGTAILVRTDAHWSLDEELRGTQDPTHLGRVLAELGIGYIRAHCAGPRAASSGCGARCRIGSAGSCACAASTPLRRRTPSCPSSSWTTIAGSPMRPSIRPRRGAARPATWPSSSAVATSGPWRGITPCASARAGCSSRQARAAAAMPVAGWTFRECLDGRFVALVDGHVLAATPSPGPDFVLQPRARPSRARPRDPARASPAPPAAPTPGLGRSRRAPAPGCAPSSVASGLLSPGTSASTRSAPPRGDIFTWQIR